MSYDGAVEKTNEKYTHKELLECTVYYQFVTID